MRQLNCYLAGPMQGIPEFNFPAFFAAEAKLKAEGFNVFNPARKDTERHHGVNISEGNKAGSLQEAEQKHGFSLRAALAEDMAWICAHADVIALLPGWEHSKGATAEHALAKALRLEFKYLN